MTFTLRPETPDDHAAIRETTRAAFAPMAFADGDEHELVGALREAGALTLSLVAEEAGRVVGHVAFSPAAAADGSSGWYTLGPVSVTPERQRAGIGSALIATGLDGLATLGARGCIVLGDPGYYARFGFELAPELAPAPEYATHFMVLITGEGAVPPNGPMRFHPLFGGG